MNSWGQADDNSSGTVNQPTSSQDNPLQCSRNLQWNVRCEEKRPTPTGCCVFADNRNLRGQPLTLNICTVNCRRYHADEDFLPMSLHPKGLAAKAHQFGGNWTERKLAAVARYLAAYTTALKNQRGNFQLDYIDAFAGSGYRVAHGSISAITPLFELDGEEPKAMRDGSATIALKSTPAFDAYYFIERHTERCRALEELREVFPARRDAIFIRNGDANREVQALCDRSWQNRRAVMFLDPYGLQVPWQTIQAIAGTKAVDMWLLFPVGSIIRMLPNDGDIPSSWRLSLTAFLGTDQWQQALLPSTNLVQPSLFDDPGEIHLRASADAIGQYFVRRLKEIFPAVADKPLMLRNSKGAPLYLLCFAAANPNGGPVALRIANHILQMD